MQKYKYFTILNNDSLCNTLTIHTISPLASAKSSQIHASCNTINKLPSRIKMAETDDQAFTQTIAPSPSISLHPARFTHQHQSK